MQSRRLSTETPLEKKISDCYRKAYRRYRDSVLKGRRCCSVAERQKVERQQRELESGVPGYRFDMKAGLRPLVWMALNLAFPMGEKQGQPMRLSDWQVYDVIVLFGWIYIGDMPEAIPLCLFFLLLILFWTNTGAGFVPATGFSMDMPLGILLERFSTVKPVTGILLSSVLICINSGLLIRIVSRNMILADRSYLPIIFYVVIGDVMEVRRIFYNRRNIPEHI